MRFFPCAIAAVILALAFMNLYGWKKASDPQHWIMAIAYALLSLPALILASGVIK